MSAPRSDRAGLLFLLVAAVGWGLNWPILKMLLAEWPPLSARGASGVVAALGLVLLAVLRGERLAVPRDMAGRLGFAAFTNVFVWMGFSTVALLWLNVGEAALLVYSMPLWGALLAWLLRGERPTLRTFAALALGFAGLAVLLGGQVSAVGAAKLPGVALTLAAAVLFALGTVTARSALPLPPIASVAWQVGLGCAPMLAAGLLFEQPRFAALSASGWATLAYMTVAPMALCYVCWFAALRRLPASTAAIGTLLVPIIGVLSAAWVLDEPFGAREAAALVLTLGGVALALRRA